MKEEKTQAMMYLERAGLSEKQIDKLTRRSDISRLQRRKGIIWRRREGW